MSYLLPAYTTSFPTLLYVMVFPKPVESRSQFTTLSPTSVYFCQTPTRGFKGAMFLGSQVLKNLQTTPRQLITPGRGSCSSSHSSSFHRSRKSTLRRSPWAEVWMALLAEADRTFATFRVVWRFCLGGFKIWGSFSKFFSLVFRGFLGLAGWGQVIY